ncbi:MAG: ABC transporter permease [Deinococcota bacterium]|jgi:ABC-type dipeptide/oligopeptide/nickel transport system permease component|nr:ABC transporter permease [Deinococcota bacterium]
MLAFILRRTVQAIGVLIFVGTLVFFLLNIAGDPVELLAPENATQAQIDQIRINFGLDQPLYLQYWRFLSSAIQGDLGRSFQTGQPAMGMIVERFPATAQLVLAAMLMALVLGVPMGVMAANRHGSLVDRTLLFVSVLGVSAPNFWLAVMLLLIFSVELNWLPAYGSGTLAHLVLPAFTLATYRIALFTRLIRATLLEELSQDYVRTARAKGVLPRLVVYRHAMRNALIPFVTVMGLEFGNLLAGAVVTESIFAWPGMNRLALRALTTLDFPVIISFTLFVALIFVVLNTLVDILYSVIDPRVRYS